LEGIAQLPPLEILVPITPGAWCAAAPLWHNPLLDSMLLGRPLAEAFPELTYLPIYTLWQLEYVMRQLALHLPVLPWIANLPVPARAPLLANLTRLQAALPTLWTQAVVLDAPPPLEAFWAVAWATLGWRLGSKDFLLAKLSVRLGTALQLRKSMQPRRDKQLAFQELAYSTSSSGAPANPGPQQPLIMPALLKGLWRLRCGNHIKEPYWRLVLDGIPTPQRMHRPVADQRYWCCCGAINADRAHHFWQCPVAQRVVAEVDLELTAFAAGRDRQHSPIATADLWLAQPPAGVRPWLWRLVCLVAVAAMDMGRSFACRLKMEAKHSGAVIVGKAGRAAMARMWDLLAEAASGRRLPLGQVPQGAQPFLFWDAAKEVWVPTRAMYQ
jgi:hypothetical protein